jgi:hypothetical protein
MSEPRVLWLRLSERVSSKGPTYLTGWSGEARVVGFRSKEPDKFGNPVWDLFLQPRQERPPAHNAARGHQDLSALSERADAWSAKQREEYSQEWAAKFDQRGLDDEPF